MEDLREKIEELQGQLEIIFQWSIVNDDGNVEEQRKRIGAIGELKLEIYPNDHPPPHFHVRTTDMNASIAISNGEIIAGDMDSKSHKKVQYFLSIHRNEVIAIWNSMRPIDCVVNRIETE